MKPQSLLFANSHFILDYCTSVPSFWIFSSMFLMTACTDRTLHHYRKFSWEGLLWFWINADHSYLWHIHSNHILNHASFGFVAYKWLNQSTKVYRKAVSCRRKILLIGSIFFPFKICQNPPLLEQSIHIIKSIFLFKNIKSSYPSMLVLWNCDLQIIWLPEKIITLAIGNAMSWMASKANNIGRFGECIWVPVGDWHAYCIVLWNRFCLSTAFIGTMMYHVRSRYKYPLFYFKRLGNK